MSVTFRGAGCAFIVIGAGAGFPGRLFGKAILSVVAFLRVLLHAGVIGLRTSTVAVVATAGADLGHVLAVTADGLAAASSGFTGFA